jgi:hypothetical protein
VGRVWDCMLCTCVSEEGGGGEGVGSEAPSLLSYTLRYVSLAELGNVCQVGLREPMHLCACVRRRGGTGNLLVFFFFSFFFFDRMVRQGFYRWLCVLILLICQVRVRISACVCMLAHEQSEFIIRSGSIV